MTTFFLDPRVIAVIVFSVLFGGIGGSAYGYYRGDVAGKNAELVIAQKNELVRQQAETTVIAEQLKTNATIQIVNEAKNLKETQDHETALKAVTTERNRLRNTAASLRISTAAICDSHATISETAGTTGTVGSTSRTVALPEKIANDLFDLAAEADTVTEQARAMQKRLADDLGDESVIYVTVGKNKKNNHKNAPILLTLACPIL